MKERVRLLEEEREEMRSKVNFVFFLLVIVIIFFTTIIAIVIIITSIAIVIVITSPSSMLSSKVNFVFVIDLITIVIIVKSDFLSRLSIGIAALSYRTCNTIL